MAADVQGVTVSFITVVVARLSICKYNEITSQLKRVRNYVTRFSR